MTLFSAFYEIFKMPIYTTNFDTAIEKLEEEIEKVKQADGNESLTDKIRALDIIPNCIPK